MGKPNKPIKPRLICVVNKLLIIPIIAIRSESLRIDLPIWFCFQMTNSKPKEIGLEQNQFSLGPYPSKLELSQRYPKKLPNNPENKKCVLKRNLELSEIHRFGDLNPLIMSPERIIPHPQSQGHRVGAFVGAHPVGESWRMHSQSTKGCVEPSSQRILVSEAWIIRFSGMCISSHLV